MKHELKMQSRLEEGSVKKEREPFDNQISLSPSVFNMSVLDIDVRDK